MKLVFYGGGSYNYNRKLNERTLALAGEKNPLITYIPSYSYGAEEDFREFVRGYRPFHITRFLYFPLDQNIDKTLLREVLKSHIIHLSGGDTFYFLKYLKKKGIFGLLKRFVQRGGILTGLSAGGIIMGPVITAASYPPFDCDENTENLTDWKGLSLTKFEFFPHYKNSHRYERELRKQSCKTKAPLMAVPDYNGIVVNGENVELLGRIYCFVRGEKVTFN